MTKPKSRGNVKAIADSAMEQGVRRSARGKATPAPAPVQKLVAVMLPGKKSTKPKQTVVDSDDEEPVDSKKKNTPASRRGKAKKKPVSPQEVSEAEDEEDNNDDDNEQEESGAEEDGGEEDELSESSEDDSGSDFEEPSSKSKNAPKTALAKKGSATKGNGGSTAAKARNSHAGSKNPRPSKTRKGQKSGKANTGKDATADEESCELYSAVLDSQVALDTVISDWATLYEESSSNAMLKLVNFLIRCCGCKHLVTAEEFEDDDNHVETLETVLEKYQTSTTNFDYPIVSKAKAFKKFKKNLLEFYTRLFQKARRDMLFNGTFMETLLSWTISLSSTPFRPVRHTATAVVLSIVSLLAEIAAEVQDELNVTNRQLATSQKQKAAQTKIKQLQKNVADCHRRKKDVLTWINEIFESVFVLRCRDVDPLVRTDCITELGRWMEANHAHFITSTYLPYLGWALSDRAPAVRLEALKVLAKLYEIVNQPNDLRQFTSRFTQRYIEMAVGETDVAARLGAIRVATLVHNHGQLEEEDLAQLSALVYGANAKVRKTIAKFVKARVWEDEVEGRLATCEVLANSSASSQGEAPKVKKEWIELKSLASFLIKVGKAEADPIETGDFRLLDEAKVGRVALVVEALWSELESLKNWKSMAEYLAMDHTVAAVDSHGGNAKPKSLEDCYYLEEEEENILLEIFVSSLQMTISPPAVPGFVKDKARLLAQHEELVDEMGHFCAGVLPQLFLKYSADPSRIRSVLVIPQLMPLNVYRDRMTPAYEELVDEVIKIFKKNSDRSVLHTAAGALRTIQGCEILRAFHEPKIDALGLHVIEAFLTAASNAGSMDGNSRDADALHELNLALNRLEHLIKGTDVTTKTSRSMAQDPFDTLITVIEQYKDGHDDHSEIAISALSIAFLWISWVCRANSSKNGQDSDWTENDTTEAVHMQESLVRAASRLAIRREGLTVGVRVRRKAFEVLGGIYWLFGGDMFHSSKGVNRHRLFLRCPEETQVECEEFVRSEIGLWGEKVGEKIKELEEARQANAAQAGQSQGQTDADSESEATEQETKEIVENERLAASLVEQEEKHEMFGTVFSFMRQIILGDIDMSHAKTVVGHYGRFGAEFDEGVKRVMTEIRSRTSQGQTKAIRDQVSEKFMSVCLDSLKEAFGNFMDGRVHTTGQVLQLAKMLTNTIRPPGFMQLARIGIHPRLMWRLQKEGIVYALELIQNCYTTEPLDEKRLERSVKFFYVLGQMLFGIHNDQQEIVAVRALIESETNDRQLNIIAGESVWFPVWVYQSKLDKLVGKAAAEQLALEKKKAAADAAAAAAENGVARAQDQQDVEMVANGQESGVTAVDQALETGGDEEDPLAKPVERVIGKKRRANSEEVVDDADRNDEEQQQDGDERGRSSPESGADIAGGNDEDDDDDVDEGDSLSGKEHKRLRVA
ncbi:hypothetical protein BGZ94_009465 [Podila epigama]|nr:hypothetical protein BGZ94_009465 [Podila epigama]